MVTSGSMSAGGKRGRWQLERDTDPKGPVNDWGSPSLDSYRARLRLYEPKGFGRVRMRHIPDASSTSLVPFVCDVVAQGAVIRTDGWGGYNALNDHRCMHERTVLSSSPDPAHVSMPGVHRVASLVKRWMLGTHQGSVTPEHLQSYLEEFTFRFNRRIAGNRGLVFQRLLQQAVATRPVTEADVTYGYEW
jgi:hypothetical protein